MPKTFETFRSVALAGGFNKVLERGAPHAQRYGPEGATHWVARLNS